MLTPRNLELARKHRLDDLRAIADDPNTTTLRRQMARQEIDQIETFGYAWPMNQGYPAGQYDDDEQQRRIAEAG